MSVDEFPRFHNDAERNRFELIDGEVYRRALTGFSDDRVKINLRKLFDRAGVEDLGFEVAISGKAFILERRTGRYPEYGSHAVIGAHPESKTLSVFTEGEWRKLTESDTLEFPALLPGVAIPVAAIFAGL
jgi:Uma2 family endonuclease